MIRDHLITRITVLALAWVASGSTSLANDATSVSACSIARAEDRVEPEVDSNSLAARPAFVAPGELEQMPSGARLVDIRRHSRKPLWRPEGALALSFLELRVMVGRAQGPVYVFGSGYDNDRIASRIADWKPSESRRVRIVRFGAAGIALAQSGAIEESGLKELLALPVGKIIPLASRGGGLVAWYGASNVPASLGAALGEIQDAGRQSASELAEWLDGRATDDDSAIVLVGNDSTRVAEAAFDASMALGRPVFHIRGSVRRIERQLDRQARLVQGRRRVGAVPCG